MAVTKYTYSIATDTANGIVDASALNSEVGASSIIIAIDNISTSGDVLDVYMKAALSTGDKTILDSTVTAHAGVALSAPDLVQISKFDTPVITRKGNIGPRVWMFSHDFTDPTTWYNDSTRMVGEAVGTGDGVATVFNLANSNIIDVTHGNISAEDDLVPSVSQGGSDYKIHVYLDAVEKIEKEIGMTSGYDYTVNYSTGDITFEIAPANTVAVTADYFYESGSTYFIRPPAGQKLIITVSETQFSKDFIMTDNLLAAVYTYDPGQGAPPAKFEYPGSKSTYKKIADFINYTNGAFPIIPAMGGTERGFSQDILHLRYDYSSAVELPDSAGAEMRMWMKNHIAYNGEFASITLYGYLESE